MDFVNFWFNLFLRIYSGNENHTQVTEWKCRLFWLRAMSEFFHTTSIVLLALARYWFGIQVYAIGKEGVMENMKLWWKGEGKRKRIKMENGRWMEIEMLQHITFRVISVHSTFFYCLFTSSCNIRPYGIRDRYEIGFGFIEIRIEVPLTALCNDVRCDSTCCFEVFCCLIEGLITLEIEAESSYESSVCKVKAIPLQGWAGPEGSRRLRLPDLKTVGT
jgi:hypothetical protein